MKLTVYCIRDDEAGLFRTKAEELGVELELTPRRLTEETARAARGCPLEITFRDITTVHGDSTRLGKAVEIARRAAAENWQP